MANPFKDWTPEMVRVWNLRNDHTTRRKLPDPKPQHHPKAALAWVAAGEEKSVPCTHVRFTGYRVRPLDPDSFAGSVKDLLDGIRRAGLIHDDSFWDIKLFTEQVKVKSRNQERTVVEIIYEGCTNGQAGARHG